MSYFNNWVHVVEEESMGTDSNGGEIVIPKHVLVDHRQNPIAHFSFSQREDEKNAVRAAISHNFCAGFSSEWLTQRSLGQVITDIIALIDLAKAELSNDDTNAAQRILDRARDIIFAMKTTVEPTIQTSMDI